MGTIPLITCNQHIVDIISGIFYDNQYEQTNLTWLKNPDIALEFIAVDMPELIMIDFSHQGFNGLELLDKITEDNWILNAGIIAFCSTFKEVENLENIRKANMIIALTNNELEFQLPKILTLIFKNRRLLFQMSISANLIKDFQATFIINNDPYEARCYANLICNFLYNSYGVSSDIKFHLKIALTELLLNAVEHGNCEISYDDKTKWMETDLDMYDLIRERLK
jgi:CheY-like chemotaxis protein